MRSDDGLVISVYREQLCIRIKSYPTWTLVHIQFIHTVIFMDNGRDRFETDINHKTGRKLSVHFELYEGAWISADSSGIWKLIGVRSTSSAFSRIKQLEQNGYIRRIPASPRAIEIL